MTEISQETIDHIPCIKAFNDVKMDNLLYKYHKSLLTLAKNKNSNKENKTITSERKENKRKENYSTKY